MVTTALGVGIAFALAGGLGAETTSSTVGDAGQSGDVLASAGCATNTEASGEGSASETVQTSWADELSALPSFCIGDSTDSNADGVDVGDLLYGDGDTRKDVKTTYTLLGGWLKLWFSGTVFVLHGATTSETAPEAEADDKDCSGTLRVTIGGKGGTSLEKATNIASELDACIIDAVVAGDADIQNYIARRPLRLRALKGTTPTLTGTISAPLYAPVLLSGVVLQRK